MAPNAKTERQPNDSPLPGRCTSCGHGYTPLRREWTQCRPCYWAARTGQSPVDPRAALRPAGRERPDGRFVPAAPNLPRMARERNKAKGRAQTLRLLAIVTRDPVAQRQLRARAYDLTHPGRLPAARAEWEARRLEAAHARAIAHAMAAVAGAVA